MRNSRKKAPLSRLISFSASPISISLALLLLRIWLGLAMIFRGFNSLFNEAAMQHFIDKYMIGVMHSSFPEFMGYVGKGFEFIGGILICVGFLTRPAVFGCGVAMFFSAFIFNSGAPFSEMELTFCYFILCLIIFISGPGKYSIDYATTRKR